MLENLERVLADKKQKIEQQARNFVAVKHEWLDRIESLYGIIRTWLSSLEEKGYVTVSNYSVKISEERLGSYEAPAMKFTFFSGEKVVLVPKGLHVIAGNGRIDMKLGLREVMIVGQDEPPGWFFAERIGRGKPRRFEFTQENFEQMLEDCLEDA